MTRKKKNKGMSDMWWLIATALIVIVVLILMILWFRGSGTRAFDTINDRIGGLGDCDKDNVGDLFDKCPTLVGDSQNEKNPGCPNNQEPTSGTMPLDCVDGREGSKTAVPS